MSSEKDAGQELEANASIQPPHKPGAFVDAMLKPEGAAFRVTAPYPEVKTEILQTSLENGHQLQLTFWIAKDGDPSVPPENLVELATYLKRLEGISVVNKITCVG